MSDLTWPVTTREKPKPALFTGSCVYPLQLEPRLAQSERECVPYERFTPGWCSDKRQAGG